VPAGFPDAQGSQPAPSVWHNLRNWKIIPIVSSPLQSATIELYSRGESNCAKADQESPRMKTRHVLFGTTLVMISGTVASEEWLNIGRSEDGKIEVFVDVTSIRAERNIRRAWTKHDYAQRSQEVAGHDPAKWIDYSVSRKAFNCTEEMSKTEAMTLYFEDGTTESVPAEHDPEPWKRVVRETLIGVEMKFVCS
jgi:hypothetical protein